MATYVLVHGAWGSGATYAPVTERLRAAGHDVHVAELTGLGLRAHQLTPGITLSDHIVDVVALFDHHDLSDAILVGHSYGGMIITGVAEARADRIKALIYIDAFLPRDGEALWDIATDWERKHYIDAQRDAPGLVGPFPGSPPNLTRHPLLTLTAPVRVGPKWASIADRTYIYATRGTPTVFTQFHDRVANDPAWHAHAVDTGHGVMTDDPETTAAILLAAAAR